MCFISSLEKLLKENVQIVRTEEEPNERDAPRVTICPQQEFGTGWKNKTMQPNIVHKNCAGQTNIKEKVTDYN